MLQVTFWLLLLLVGLVMRQSGSIYNRCIKLLDTIICFERQTIEIITELEQTNNILEGQNYVSNLQ